MGKFTNGPDWTDISNWMRENEVLTGFEYTLLVTPSGSHGGLPLSCTVLATKKGLAPWVDGQGYALTVTWPNRESRTFEGAIFRGLVAMDGLLYSQRTFVEP